MSRQISMLQRIGIVALVALQSMAMIAGGAVWTNAFGAGDRFDGLMTRVRLVIAPPPDREIQATVEIAPPPSPAATPRPTVAPALEPGASPASVVTPAPTPVRRRVDVKLRFDPERMFASEYDITMCSPAAIQMTLAMHGLAKTDVPFQVQLDQDLGRWESRRDARAGGWGPASIAAALDSHGAAGYEIHASRSRMDALRDAAVQLTITRAPVILLAWRGAHTWVMTGFRADADPTIFPDATILGAYIYDPWYPRVSTIWGPSDPPGTFQDWDEMQRNFLEWKRPEGEYPDRDGRFIVVVPTIPRAEISG